MRLNNFQIQTIKKTVTEIFGENKKIYLFGSRANDSTKGGDIDILLETSDSESEALKKTIKTLARLSLRMGEQKIDLITTQDAQKDHRRVVKEAINSGLRL